MTTWWDVTKKKLKDITIWCSCKIAKDNSEKLHGLEVLLEKAKESGSKDEKYVTSLTLQLRSLYEERANGAKIRSRVNWFDKGEKPTKYFHNLEKKNSKDKSWESILDSDGNIIHGTDNILKRQAEFYKHLYTTENISEEKGYPFLNHINRGLSEHSKGLLDNDFSLSEATLALRKMANNKSPGSDGIITEFYKIYWSQIREVFLEVCRSGYKNERLAYTQYQAVITLLYKKGVREDIRNWRPISLINTDSKIISKILSERLKKVLPEIIHTDQKGCVANRFIGQNVRLIEDILQENNDDYIFLLLDQEKAFDRVEWTWLYKVLDKFNFGSVFKKWIEVIYCNMKSAVLANGYMSSYFSITRGIRQGDSLSALLYVIQAEPLAEFFRQCGDIKGIRVIHGQNDTEVKICQYVDDAVIPLQNTGMIKRTLDIIYDFGMASGSRLNLSKTVGLTSRQELHGKQIYGINMTVGPEKLLGIPVGKNCVCDEFWNKLLDKVKNRFMIWRGRDLSLSGRVHIIKSLGIASVLYACEMKTMERRHVDALKKMLWDFLWKGKRCTVKKEFCYLPRDKGGIGMIDFESVLKVKRIKWLIRVLKANEQENWSIIPMKFVKLFDHEFKINLFLLRVDNAEELINSSNIPQFYKECLLYFQEMSRMSRVVQKNQDEILWCNSLITFHGKPLCYRHWSDVGIQFISDVVQDGALREGYIYEVLTRKAGFMFEVHTMKKSLPNEYMNRELDTSMKDRIYTREDVLRMTFSVPDRGSRSLYQLTAKDIYNIFVKGRRPESKSEVYWQRKFPEHELDFSLWYQEMFCNKLCERKALDFNWKLFHGQVNAETKLKAMGFSDGFCKICKIEQENTEHIFICKDIENFWSKLEETLEIIDMNLPITRFQQMVGVLNEGYYNSIMNMILSMSRWEIWKRRCTYRYENRYLDEKCLTYVIFKRLVEHIKVLMKLNWVKEKTDLKVLLSKTQRAFNSFIL